MTRQRLSREDRRNKILEAATEVFGRLGFEFTRMEDVAKAAGIAKGLLYKHFSSKDALFEALIDRQGRAYAAELRGALQVSDIGGDPLGALRAGLGFWLRTITHDHATFNFTDPGSHNAYDGLRASLRQVIAESVQLADPTVEDTYAHLIAALIQGAAENLGLAWRDDPGPVAPEEALDMLANFCWGGLMQLQRSTATNSGRPVEPRVSAP
ncbi:MAG: TetR/AcrR family transcriptional regulator [Acidimicrobiales bacterium]